MARPRLAHNADLPSRMTKRKASGGRFLYYFRTTTGGAIALGDDFEAAQEKMKTIDQYVCKSPLPFWEWELFAKKLVWSSRRNAKNRGIEFHITDEMVCGMLKSSSLRCSLTGIAFSLEKPEGHRIRPFAPSIDRINARGAYTPENCRIVCACVNVALNEFGDELLCKIADGLRLKNKSLL